MSRIDPVEAEVRASQSALVLIGLLTSHFCCLAIGLVVGYRLGEFF